MRAVLPRRQARRCDLERWQPYVWTAAAERWLELRHGGLLHWLAFSPDSERVAVAAADGSVPIWPITVARVEAVARDVWRDLTPEERRKHVGR